MGCSYSISDNERTEFVKESKQDEDSIGLYDVAVSADIPKSEVDEPSLVRCVMSIPGTNYTKTTEGSFVCKSEPPCIGKIQI